MSSLSAPDEDEFARSARFGKYEIALDPVSGDRRVLGRGGMGVTYKARDAQLRRLVVLKVMGVATAGDPEIQRQARKRFLREARALALLRHPAIPFLYEYGEVGGEDFYAMEFIAGEDLHRRIKHSGALELPEALAILEQAARALGAAHRAGIVHRDVKPANLMLARPEEGGPETVKLIDFGLAKGSGETLDFGLSTTGDKAGFTPLFASPEQCRQEPATAKSDLYSLGATLWFLLTGQAPYGGTSAWEVAQKHVSAPLPLERLPSRLPEPVRHLLVRLLAKSAADRPESADEVVGEVVLLRRLLGSQTLPTAAPSLGSAPTLRPAAVAVHLPDERGWNWLLLAGVGAAAAAVGLLGIWAARESRTAPARPVPTSASSATPRPIQPTAPSTPRKDSVTQAAEDDAELRSLRAQRSRKHAQVEVALAQIAERGNARQRAEANLLRARNFADQDKLPEALSRLTASLQDEPDRREVLFHRAELARRLGRVSSALADFDAAAQTPAPPDQPPPAALLAFRRRLLLIENDREAEIGSAYLEELQKRLVAGEWILTAAAVNIHRGNFTEAASWMHRAKGVMPTDEYLLAVEDHFFRSHATRAELAEVLPNDRQRREYLERARPFLTLP